MLGGFHFSVATPPLATAKEQDRQPTQPPAYNQHFPQLRAPAAPQKNDVTKAGHLGTRGPRAAQRNAGRHAPWTLGRLGEPVGPNETFLRGEAFG